MTTPTNWRKSSYSHDNGCVELADLSIGTIGLRDSKLGDDSPVLSFTRREIWALLEGAKAGEFDDLT